MRGRDIKGEARMAPSLSVGMGWHLGSGQSGHTSWKRAARQWGFVTENNLCVRPRDKVLSLLIPQQMGRPRFQVMRQTQPLLWKQSCYLYVSENATCVCVSIVLTMMTRRIFWKLFLKPSVELQKRAKLPSRSCGTKHTDTLQFSFAV